MLCVRCTPVLLTVSPSTRALLCARLAGNVRDDALDVDVERLPFIPRITWFMVFSITSLPNELVMSRDEEEDDDEEIGKR